jgi:hypothetical protein
VVDEFSFITLGDGGQTLAEALSVRELHGNDQLARLIYVAPLAGIRNQSDIGNPFFSDVDGGEPFGKIADDVELSLEDGAAGGIDKEFLSLERHQRQPLTKTVSAVELKWDDDLSSVIDESALTVLVYGKECRVRLRLGQAELAYKQAKAQQHKWITAAAHELSGFHKCSLRFSEHERDQSRRFAFVFRMPPLVESLQ